MAKDEAFLKDADKMQADIVVGTGEEVAGLYRQDLCAARSRWSSAPSQTFKSASGRR